MDELIAAEAGGLNSRAGLAREAIEAMVMELRYGLADPEAQPHPSPILKTRPATGTTDVAFTSLDAPLELSYFVDPLPPSKMHPRWEKKPQRGLHNRDYPSLWAGTRLCRLLQTEPMEFDLMAEALIDEAWAFGEQLTLLDDAIAGKPSALFPTNPRKRQSAENNFMVFAVGSFIDGSSGPPQAIGPLFTWKILGLAMASHGPQVGMTRVGQDLLASMAGLTVAQPHPPEYTQRFLAHLSEHAPGDREGFLQMMRAVSSHIGRDGLIDAFNRHWPDWNRNVASTNAAGYIARGREWGLVEMGQVNKRYALTELGQQVLSDWDGTHD